MNKEAYFMLREEERREVDREHRVLNGQIEYEWKRLGKSPLSTEFSRCCMKYVDDLDGFLTAIRRGDFGKPKEE